MTYYLLIWANHNRALLIGLLGASLWAAAYIWYFSVNLERFWQHRKPRKWSADMQTKTGKGGIDRPM